jgi:hypothetical protein
MVLVSIEIWICCDLIATSVCPLLNDYDPQIPIDPLQNLLLPFAGQMRRLTLAEEYLVSRKNWSHLNHHMYQVIGDARSFPVRYFDGYPEHSCFMRYQHAPIKPDKKNW